VQPSPRSDPFRWAGWLGNRDLRIHYTSSSVSKCIHHCSTHNYISYRIFDGYLFCLLHTHKFSCCLYVI
jgi:hypothetical protein